MYCNFFGFSEKPFDVTPDPKFLYLTPGHREALAALVYGMRERRGFITIVGEVGTGKTTLLNAALGRLDEKTSVAYIFNTDANFDQMLIMALVDLGLAKSNETLSKVEAIQRLNDFAVRQLSNGGNVVLVVDEAHNLVRRSMEGLRLLSNLETRKHKLIQIVLSGQPELDVKLNRAELRQLDQRISLRRYISPLSEKETYDYIRHRLGVADYREGKLFSRQARQRIWDYSGGVPRKINILCDNALLIAYGLRKKTVQARVVEEAIRDLSWSPFSKAAKSVATIAAGQPLALQERKSARPRFVLASSIGALFACLVLVVSLFFGNVPPDLQKSVFAPQHSEIGTKFANQLNSSDQAPAEAVPVSPEPTSIDKRVKLASASLKNVESKPGLVYEVLHIYTSLAARLARLVGISHHTVEEFPHGRDYASGVGGDHHTEAEPTTADSQGPAANFETALDASLNPQSDPGQKDEDLAEHSRVVLVKRGDSLSKLIIRSYGEYNSARLSAVLAQNPEIQNPDHILVDQAIKIPLTTESD